MELYQHTLLMYTDAPETIQHAYNHHDRCFFFQQQNVLSTHKIRFCVLRASFAVGRKNSGHDDYRQKRGYGVKIRFSLHILSSEQYLTLAQILQTTNHIN